MDDKDETILWMARSLAQAKKNETRLNGEVLKGNAIIASLEGRVAALEEQVANLTKDAPRGPIEPASADGAKG